jgi:hypothetical protein
VTAVPAVGLFQVKVQASAPGYAPVVLTLEVAPQPPNFQQYWCHNGPRL